MGPHLDFRSMEWGSVPRSLNCWYPVLQLTNCVRPKRVFMWFDRLTDPPCLMVKPTNFATIPHFGDVSTAKNHLKAQEMLQKTLVFQGNIPIFHGNTRVKSSNSEQNQVSASAWTSSPGGGSWLMGCPLGAGGGGLFVSGLSQGFESPQTMLWVGQRQENGRMGDRHHIFSLI